MKFYWKFEIMNFQVNTLFLQATRQQSAFLWRWSSSFINSLNRWVCIFITEILLILYAKTPDRYRKVQAVLCNVAKKRIRWISVTLISTGKFASSLFMSADFWVVRNHILPLMKSTVVRFLLLLCKHRLHLYHMQQLFNCQPNIRKLQLPFQLHK